MIGGAACDILMSEEDIDFRLTKDIDMILIMEDKKNDFAKTFWEFIREAGEHVNERDYKKHKNDVFRLLQIVNPDEKIAVGGLVKESIEDFLSDIEQESIRTEQLGLMISQEEAVELLRHIYL